MGLFAGSLEIPGKALNGVYVPKRLDLKRMSKNRPKQTALFLTAYYSPEQDEGVTVHLRCGDHVFGLACPRGVVCAAGDWNKVWLEELETNALRAPEEALFDLWDVVVGAEDAKGDSVLDVNKYQ